MSQKTYKLILSGELETQSPIAIVPPNAREITEGGGKYKQVSRRTLFRHEARINTPVVPGSTMRGKLRRSANEAVMRLSGERVSIDEFHQNAVGGVKGSDKEDGFDVTGRIVAREKNPILALFGAGEPWMTSRAMVPDMVPLEAITTDVIGGVRSDDGRRDDEFFTKLTDESAENWRSMIEANSKRTQAKGRVASLKKDLRAAKTKKQDADVKRLEAELKEAEKDANQTGTNPVSMPISHEAIPSGVKMSQKIVLEGVTLEEIGLFMAAMNFMWKETPNIGQHGSKNYGLIGGTYEVKVEDVGAFDPFKSPEENATNLKTLQTITVTPHAGCENMDPFLLEAMQAFVTAFNKGAYDFRVVKEVLADKKKKS